MAKSYTLPSDAVWFITGCSSGLGHALAAHILTHSSNRVVATARDISKLATLPETDKLLKVILDVTSSSSIEAAISLSLNHFKRIDVFVNNAGYGLFGDTEASDLVAAQKVMETNFWGPVAVTKAALPILREENIKNGGQRGGVIVQISSVGGRIGVAGNAFYHAAKFALEGFSESVAKELSSDWNIHFCIAEPGGIKTKYASTSMEHIPLHPAYTNPSLATNQLRAYMANPDASKYWAEPETVAETIYSVVKYGVEGANGGKGGIPLRLPLGADSWGLLKGETGKSLKELDVLEPISLKTSSMEQLASIEFLRQ